MWVYVVPVKHGPGSPKNITGVDVISRVLTDGHHLESLAVGTGGTNGSAIALGGAIRTQSACRFVGVANGD